MTDAPLRSGLLDGKEAIRDYLGGASDYKLRQYLRAGMPVLIDEHRWLAHSDNLEEFFRKLTRVDSRSKGK